MFTIHNVTLSQTASVDCGIIHYELYLFNPFLSTLFK